MLMLHKIEIGAAVLAALLVGIATAEPEKDPAWKAEFHKAYGLKDDELTRSVAPPYPKCREEYFRDQIREVYKRIKKDPPEGLLQNFTLLTAP